MRIWLRPVKKDEEVIRTVPVGSSLRGLRIEKIELDWKDIRSIREAPTDGLLEWFMDVQRAMVKRKNA